MSVIKKWSFYSKENVNKEPDNYGAYLLATSKDILYIGEGHVKTRLLAHFPDAKEPIVGSSSYRYELTGSKESCVKRQNELLDEYKRQHNGNLPPFNTRSKN